MKEGEWRSRGVVRLLGECRAADAVEEARQVVVLALCPPAPRRPPGAARGRGGLLGLARGDGHLVERPRDLPAEEQLHVRRRCQATAVGGSRGRGRAAQAATAASYAPAASGSRGRGGRRARR